MTPPSVKGGSGRDLVAVILVSILIAIPLLGAIAAGQVEWWVAGCVSTIITVIALSWESPW